MKRIILFALVIIGCEEESSYYPGIQQKWFCKMDYVNANDEIITPWVDLCSHLEGVNITISGTKTIPSITIDPCQPATYSSLEICQDYCIARTSEATTENEPDGTGELVHIDCAEY